MNSHSKLKDVLRYWQDHHASYLTCLGTTLQAALAFSGSGQSSVVANNRWLAGRAGIRRGQRILDAGCGVFGPALDIAEAFPRVQIFGLTISQRQAAHGAKRANLGKFADRLHSLVGDYHQLPFSDAVFDRVLFLESAGYAFAPDRLWSEVFRVLVPGGEVYIKDIFFPDSQGARSDAQKCFDSCYAAATPTVSELITSLEKAGLQVQSKRDLTGQLHFDRWRAALGLDAATPTQLGRQHELPEVPPIEVHEIRACRNPGDVESPDSEGC